MVDCELLLGVSGACEGIGHEQRHLIALRRRWVGVQKFAAGTNDRLILPVVCVNLDEAGMQPRASGGTRKALIEQSHQFSCARAMEIGNSALFLLRVFALC